MRLATRIGTGYAAVIAAMLGLLLYQGIVIYQMQSTNRRLSDVLFESAGLSAQLNQALDPIEEFTRKYLVTRDSGYLARIRERQDLWNRDLEKLMSLSPAPSKSLQISSLIVAWNQYRKMASRLEKLSAAEEEAWLNQQVDQLQALRQRTSGITRTVQDAILAQVRQATRAGARAERISILVAVATLSGSLVVALMMVRSAARDLNRMTRGTQALSKGDFDYRLDSSSNDEFADLARDFNSMAERLGELDQMKKDFVSHVSHELKTPLVSMQETVNLLLEEIPGSLAAEQKRLLQLNLESSQRLFSLIQNLLQMSRVEAGTLEYHPKECDLISLVETVVKELTPQLRERKLRITTQFQQRPVFGRLDRVAFLQLVSNLLGNALKYSPDGGEVLVRTHFPRKTSDKPVSSPGAPFGNGYLQLSVSDQGPGVPNTQRERIFQKFYQVPPQEGASRPGVGLGLAICKSIVEGHRGRIWVEDGPDGGSDFRVLLPLGPEG